ncbi:hypothetical protein [Tetragenococcus halophilus]|uniref:Uncharacterized protein n=1 Tax=Tetragenococcus halophilus (strain DSM 20338 / JCM 20259 / NCIMB 9735 / NBRC 12172) TaxID=945021 RepID=A0AAN1SHQ0_TETHN|nr:hypothetical protein [Tetragenococcus halophilus]QXN87819.1 hypothetical protein KV134_05630 [Tetragenococcus halophilus]WJS83064.1 hypothetical protein KFZ55_05890 [Tetragenococcus halophilus]BAK94811.1 hypothetical protein TEH_14840 [Tetragenococcus halophilus NBRC 12172]GBD65249.1 putative uncharacterized protein [Tetragenococcus halophilus subsp. halophilus]GBD71384.1 putative uncharacterized protein [Tetragenococcus halophilus subsp. halophilus]
MTIKRFVQLFICYFVSITIAMLATKLFSITNIWLAIILVAVIGYVVLIIPLTILTLSKQKK